MPKQHYPAEFKQEAASLVLDQDYTRAAACEAMGVGKTALVRCQPNNGGFSELVCAHGKAHFAGNAYCLSKERNTAMGANKLTRRACPWHPAAALHRLAID